jgi:hypothetical protein
MKRTVAIVLFAFVAGCVLGAAASAAQGLPIGLQVSFSRTVTEKGKPDVTYQGKGVLLASDEYRDVTIDFPADRLTVHADEAKFDRATNTYALQGNVRLTVSGLSLK